MTTPVTLSIALVRRLNASPSQLFAACTDPKLIARWLVPGAGDVVAVTADPRPGGRYSIEGLDPNRVGYTIRGAYLEVVPERRLVMTWDYDGAVAPLRGETSLVTIELRRLGEDVTELTLSHEQLSAQETADIYGRIWKLCLDRLKATTDPTATEQAFRFPGGMLSDIYGEQHRAVQEAFGVTKLANRLRDLIVADELSDDQQRFIAGRDMFFLTTVDQRGYPTCSYKGGDRGFVRVLDKKTLVFPSYNGNGMFLSMGNLTANPKVGLLFIDFERPDRIRVHGTATARRDDPLIGEFAGAELLVRVAISEVFVNCPRYIHRYRRIASSKYVPQAGCQAPLPAWKRVDLVQDALPDRDRAAVVALGQGVITPEEYAERLKRGEA
jgi:uncharacterized protein YndB with AHSA1/START domain/predicted pyridoxine 5'-phosphate oxidase superfamily flavin-nucleotide-binding protein